MKSNSSLPGLLLSKQRVTSTEATEVTERSTSETSETVSSPREHQGKKYMPKALPPLTKADCGNQWGNVVRVLAQKQIEGLSIEDDHIVFTSMLGDQSRDDIAKLIGNLVDANCFVAACTLVRVFKPSVRPELLNLCGRERVERLRKSDEIRAPLNRALDAAAHDALRNRKFRELFGLLPWCPSKTRASVMAMCPSLTMEMISNLNGDEFVEAVRLAVDGALMRDTVPQCLTELRLLLLFADELKTPNFPWMVTMTAIIRLALDKRRPGADEVELTEFAAKLKDMAQLPDLTPDLVSRIPANGHAEVLRVAVAQAEDSPAPDVCAKRLQGLATLIDKLGESDADQLRSDLMSAESRLLVRWDESVYQAHKGSLPAIPAKPEKSDRILRSRLLSSIVRRTGNTVERPADSLIHLADGFRRAIDTDDLRTATLLIRDCPYPEFGNPARERLTEAVIAKLAAAGYKAELRPVSFMVLAEKSTDVERDEQRSVALQMAVALAATGDPECSRLAGTILSIVFPMPQDPEWAIHQMVGEPKRDIVGAMPTLMIYALPLLCSAALSPELDVILKMAGGQQLVAQAVVDGFANGQWNNDHVAALFNELAYRLDLGPALLALQAITQLEKGGRGHIDPVLDGSPLTDLKRMAAYGAFIKLSVGQIRHDHPWARGWKFVWVMLAANTVFLNDPMLLMGGIAIDAAAADSLRGGADELLHRLKFPWAQNALDVMLQLKIVKDTLGNHTPLLSNDDLHNVLRAMFSDEQLGRDTFFWMGAVDDPERRVALHAAAAKALISLADDSSPCRFYPDLRADHVVDTMVRMFEFRVVSLLKIGMDVENRMGKEAWLQISSKFAHRRTGFGTVLLATQAINAAAADGLYGGAKELLDRLDDSLVESALSSMLKPQVNLLSDDALVNVMRAFVSDGRLAARAFEWRLPSSGSVRLHRAAAHALISLLDDVTPCRFDPTRPANHAVARVARDFLTSLADNGLTHDFEKELGEEAFKRIDAATQS